MSQSSTTSAATPDVIEDVEPTVVTDATSHAPVFITPQEVMFSTAVARSWLRPASMSRRVIEAIRGVGAAVPRPPARGHYPQRFSCFEDSRMAREMVRL